MVVTLRTSQPSLSTITETMALYGLAASSMALACRRSSSSSSLLLPEAALGDLAVGLGVDDRTAPFSRG
jgi:hypothetical protein